MPITQHMNNKRGTKRVIYFTDKEIIAQDYTTQNNWLTNDKEKTLKKKKGPAQHESKWALSLTKLMED